MNRISLPISLVIPCFNRHDQTKNLLESLRQSAFRCQTIIIDDHSDPDFAFLVSEFDDLNLVYHRNLQNKGPAYSRNRGIECAKYEYIAFTDNDCVMDSEWLLHLHDAISKSNKSVAGVGGRVLSKTESIISLYFTYHKILDPWFNDGRYHYLVTANSIFRKSALLRVGGFDESIKIAGGEDPGMCFKLIKEGYDLDYAPSAIIYHDYHLTVTSFLYTFYRYGYGCARQSIRHYISMPARSRSPFGGMNNCE